MTSLRPNGLRLNGPASRRVLETCARFGMRVRCGGAPAGLRAPVRACVAILVRPGAIVLAQGASGSGKTRTLGVVTDHLRAHSARVVRAQTWSAEADPDVRVLDAIADARLLCACGLADAKLWTRRLRELSDGERARMNLAIAIDRLGGERGVVVADEFASVLDRASAQGLCVTMRRLVRSGGFSLLCATAHEDVAGWLRPDLAVRCAGGRADWREEERGGRGVARSGRRATQRCSAAAERMSQSRAASCE